MFGGDQRNAVLSALAPWIGMARADAREWFRDHPGAPLEEFDHWVCASYEPYVLRGYAYRGGRLGRQLNEVLDDVHVGLQEALDAERRQRAHRAA